MNVACTKHRLVGVHLHSALTDVLFTVSVHNLRINFPHNVNVTYRKGLTHMNIFFHPPPSDTPYAVDSYFFIEG